MNTLLKKYCPLGIISLCMLSLVTLLTSCEKKKDTVWPGYIEGKYLFITDNSAGTLQSINVKPGDQVKAKTELYSLNTVAEDEEIKAANARLDQAQAQEQKARYEYKLQKSIYNRKRNRYNKKSIKKEEYDIARTNYDQSRSDLSAAESNTEALKAQLSKLKWMKEQKTVVSPVDALVFETYFQKGEQINVGIPVLALLPPNQIKVIFYVRGSDLAKFKLNQKVKVTCTNCTQSIPAQINFISPKAEFTPPVLYSSEMSSKLTFRVEALPEPTEVIKTLLPGQPVTVSL